MSILKRCPFCDKDLVRSDTFSNVTADHYVHPDNDCFLAHGSTHVVVSNHAGDRDRVEQWNDRPSASALLPRYDDNDFETELQRRIAAGEIDISDSTDPDDPDDFLLLPYAGTIEVNIGALDDAIARLSRGEVREALFQLNKAVDGRLDQLVDLKPEDLK